MSNKNGSTEKIADKSSPRTLDKSSKKRSRPTFEKYSNTETNNSEEQTFIDYFKQNNLWF